MLSVVHSVEENVKPKLLSLFYPSPFLSIHGAGNKRGKKKFVFALDRRQKSLFHPIKAEIKFPLQFDLQKRTKKKDFFPTPLRSFFRACSTFGNSSSSFGHKLESKRN